MMSKTFDGYGSIHHPEPDEEATASSVSPLAIGLRQVFSASLLVVLVACFAWMEKPWMTTNRKSDSRSPAEGRTSRDWTASLVTHTETASGHTTKSRNNNNQHHDPDTALFFDQIVDHNIHPSSNTFPQRYYENRQYWKGAGHPIFFIFGGEGPLERILYPFISEVLAQAFGAVTVNLEHRYFGVSYPVQNYHKHDIAEQLTPKQALQDAITFLQAKQRELGCGPRGSSTYCPVMTVGASYAGLLSTLARKMYPNVVDMAYAASPCLLLYGHEISPDTYYEYITQVADRISPGCSDAVRGVIAEVKSDLSSISSSHDLQSKAEEYGICTDLPENMRSGTDLAETVIEYTSSNFAETNMDYYPPTQDKKFYQGCVILEDETRTTQQRVRDYIHMISESSDCYALPEEDDNEADLWDALCCYLVPMIGKSDQSMWPARSFSLAHEVEHCQQEFGITADPDYLNREFGLNDLTNMTRLLLTNGRNDGWYSTSYVDHIVNATGFVFTGIVVMSMETGAHHSDLTHQLQQDTLEIAIVHEQTRVLLAAWLEAVQAEGA